MASRQDDNKKREKSSLLPAGWTHKDIENALKPVPRPDYVKFVSSRPTGQFLQQREVLEQRLNRYFERDPGADELIKKYYDPYDVQELYGVNLKWEVWENTGQILKARWIRDGIWNPNWDNTNTFDKWAHEEAEEILGIEPDASRPAQQFEKQIAAELEWLERAGTSHDAYDPELDPEAAILEMRTRFENDGPRTGSGFVDLLPKDWTATARENVRRIWKLNNMWDPSWGATPGREWMHEKYDPALFPMWEVGPNQCPREPLEIESCPPGRRSFDADTSDSD